MLSTVPELQTCNLFKSYTVYKNLLANLKKKSSFKCACWHENKFKTLLFFGEK